MDFDQTNNDYWSKVEPDKILSGVHFPGSELFNLLIPEASILEIGCGNGKVSNFLFNEGYQVTGIDINMEALDSNRLQNSEISYKYADVTQNLPFFDQIFDAVVIPYVFVSIIDTDLLKNSVHEILRVLKKGGVVWLCEATYSLDYVERYKNAKSITGLDMTAISYEKDSFGHETPIIKRIIRHFSKTDIDNLFPGSEKIYQEIVSEKSPSSGMTVETLVTIFKNK